MIQPLANCVAGLDVHKEVVVCSVLYDDDQGQIHKQTKSFKTFNSDLDQLVKWLKSFEMELVAMESTGIYWKKLYEILEEAQLKTIVVNARYMKQVPGRKTDVADSEWIAELARCGLLKASFIPPQDFRELRLLTRYRKKLTGTLSAEKNRTHKVLESLGIKLSCVVSDIDGVSARKMIDAILQRKQPEEIVSLAMGRLKTKKADLLKALRGYHLSNRNHFLLQGLQNHIQWLENKLEQIDSQIFAAMEPYDNSWKILQTLPGIDKLSAAMLLAEFGIDMSHFKNQHHFSSWAGMSPGNNESAGKKKSAKTRKGNHYIRILLCEIANSARHTNSQFKGIYQGLVIRKGHKRSIIAIGHKILEIIYVLLKKQIPYKDPQFDYEQMMVKKNAPRWIQALKKYDFLSEEIFSSDKKSGDSSEKVKIYELRNL